MRKRPRFAASPLGRSRAASIARAPNWPICSASRKRRTSAWDRFRRRSSGPSRPASRLVKRFGLNTVWARLLGLMTLIVVPTAIVIFILAYSLYSAALAELSASQATEAAGRARAIGDWLDAAGRALSSEAAAADLVEPSRCGLLAQSF